MNVLYVPSWRKSSLYLQKCFWVPVFGVGFTVTLIYYLRCKSRVWGKQGPWVSEPLGPLRAFPATEAQITFDLRLSFSNLNIERCPWKDLVSFVLQILQVRQYFFFKGNRVIWRQYGLLFLHFDILIFTYS